jgi:hypothetical protein
MTGVIPGGDETVRQGYVEVMREWQAAGIIGPDWEVDWSVGYGCYWITFTLFATWGPRPRIYQLNENDFCQRVIALADMFPDEVGPAAVALAADVREEIT